MFEPHSFRFMLCETKVEERGWDIESRIQFTSDGLVNTVTCKRDNVMMRAHYREEYGTYDLLSLVDHNYFESYPFPLVKVHRNSDNMTFLSASA